MSEVNTPHADVVWTGSLKEGAGEISLGSGLFKGPYSFASRFEGAKNATTPEELIAAAHSACFSMATCAALTKAGHVPDKLDCHADVDFKTVDGKPSIAAIHLTIRGTVPGLANDEFVKIAEDAKANCPVSRALAGVPSITLDAKLA